MVKLIAILLFSLCSLPNLKAQAKGKIVLGTLYMKDTVTIIYLQDTLDSGVLQTNFNGHLTKIITFKRIKKGNEAFRVHINGAKVSVLLNDFRNPKKLRIDCIPNPQAVEQKEIRIYQVK